MWSGRDFQEAAYMEPISKEVTKICTPRVCTQYNLPWFNIGKDDEEEWVKVVNGELLKAEKPNKLCRKCCKGVKIAFGGGWISTQLY